MDSTHCLNNLQKPCLAFFSLLEMSLCSCQTPSYIRTKKSREVEKEEVWHWKCFKTVATFQSWKDSSHFILGTSCTSASPMSLWSPSSSTVTTVEWPSWSDLPRAWRAVSFFLQWEGCSLQVHAFSPRTSQFLQSVTQGFKYSWGSRESSEGKETYI